MADTQQDTAKRKLEEAHPPPVPGGDSDEDMLSICNLIKESAAADVEELCNVLCKMGLMSIKRNDVSRYARGPGLLHMHPS